jgi:hypothetical protein
MPAKIKSRQPARSPREFRNIFSSRDTLRFPSQATLKRSQPSSAWVSHRESGRLCNKYPSLFPPPGAFTRTWRRPGEPKGLARSAADLTKQAYTQLVV